MQIEKVHKLWNELQNDSARFESLPAWLIKRKKIGFTSKSKAHLKSLMGERNNWKEVKTVEVISQEPAEV